ncbi:MAG: SGNH/GDSL hydrolase family protein [Acidimicrobiales bacterium]
MSGVVALAVVAGAFFVGRTSAPDASAASSSASTPVTFSAFYLDVGASESLGFQPTGVTGHNGARTNTGYANSLVFREAIKGVALDLEQIGCPGDTVQSLLTTKVSDACYQAPNNQLTKATSYLQAHQADPGLVTVDLGFNNVRLCLEAHPVNESCLDQGIAAVENDLPKILKTLKSSAGPKVHFVGLEYSDPYLGYFLDGPNGPADATETLDGIDQLNTVLVKIYTNAGVAVANVPSLFQTDNTVRTTMDNVGSIPVNVQQACLLSWFCESAPFGPDDHPNNAGYSLIAAAIEAVLPKSW